MTKTQQLFEETEVLLAETGAIWKRLVHPTIRLLAEGRPVMPGEIAAASGVALPEVEQALVEFTDVEWDEAGRVVGMGLTMRPTPHVMRIGDKTLYAWCAMDTLAFTAILDRTVTIESPDHRSGEPIRIRADGEGVVSADPASTVVSWWIDPSVQGVRDAVCRNGHFFTSAPSAAGWLAERRGGSIIPLEEAFTAARRMAFEVLGDAVRGAEAAPRRDHGGATRRP